VPSSGIRSQKPEIVVVFQWLFNILFLSPIYGGEVRRGGVSNIIPLS
jgi:hypothetical protein